MPKCSHPKCNNEVAWDAQVCPSCGKQNPSGCAKLILTIVIIFIILVILASLGNKS